mmetsp:Transcript_2081/g.4724  ORF Transcript_2081/g.4724 Transcript_2081/m.4724 type:complete len:374 (+) Transcript_2081:56-1177(+)
MASTASSWLKPLLGSKPNEPPPKDTTMAHRREQARISNLLDISKYKPPPKLVACIEKAKPVLELLVMGIRLVAPLFLMFYKMLYYAYKVIPATELKMLYGITLCFFGGKYCATLAAVECFRRTGGDKLLLCLQDLATNAQVAWQANLKDDQLDENEDGIMDVKQISNQEWYKRKVAVVLKAVDPDTCVTALAGLYQGFLGMLMALKFKFAWTVALACSIADVIRKPIALALTPTLGVLMPKEYHKWIPQIINLTMKGIAVHLAWKLQMIVSACQSGILGASLFGTGVVTLLMQGFTWSGCGGCLKGRNFDPDQSFLDEAIGLPIAIAGIWFQLKHNFTLPWPMNVFLLPLTLLEEVLRFLIVWFPVTDDIAMG